MKKVFIFVKFMIFNVWIVKFKKIGYIVIKFKCLMYMLLINIL